MDKVRFAVCGTGGRGSGLTRAVLAKFDDVEIVGLADPYVDKAETLRETLKDKISNVPAVYGDHIKMFDELKPDAVLVSTSWATHLKVAMDAMRRGIAVALEVGGAYSIEDCYELVRVYEETKTPLMFMENCCYDKDELIGLNMARKGLLGEIVYCHGAYAHDLREEVSYGDVKRHYRQKEYMNRNCDNYPTHELGPIAKILGINRGNRMVSLVSMSSKARGLHEYIMNREDLSHLKDVEFKQGDVVQTLIKCENGEMISIKLDTTLPRYYSREFTLRGTKGMLCQESDMVLLDGKYTEYGTPYKTIKEYGGNIDSFSEYMPKIWSEVTPEILKAGHGGMDYFVFRAFVDAFKKGEEMPIDVYDAASWMVISCLSEQSIKNNGQSVEIPDFTNGKYKERPIKDVVSFD